MKGAVMGWLNDLEHSVGMIDDNTYKARVDNEDRVSRMDRETQKTDVINILEDTKVIEEDIVNIKGYLKDYDKDTTNDTAVVDALMNNRHYNDIDIAQYRDIGYSDRVILNSIQPRTEQLKEHNKKIQKNIDMTKYDISITGDTFSDDLALGIRQTLEGVKRTGLDAGNAITLGHLSDFTNIKDYDTLDKESRDKLKVIEESVVDKDFFSANSIGKIVPFLGNLPLAVEASVASSLLIAAEGYASNRANSDSTVGGSIVSGIFGVAVSKIPEGIDGVGNIIKGKPQAIWEKLNDYYNLSSKEYNTITSDYLKHFKSSGNPYKDRITAVLHSTNSQIPKLGDRGKNIINEALGAGDSLATQMDNTLSQAKADVLDYLNSKINTQRLGNPSKDRWNKLVNTVGNANDKVSRLYNDFSKGILNNNKIIIQNDDLIDINSNIKDIGGQIATKQQELLRLKKASADLKKNDIKPPLTLQGSIDEVSNDIQKLQLTKADKVKQRTITKTSSYKLDDLPVSESDLLLKDAVTEVKNILGKEQVTMGDAMVAYKQLNKALNRPITDGTKKANLTKLKNKLSTSIESKMTKKELEEWHKVNKAYSNMAKVKYSMLGEAIDKIRKSSKENLTNAMDTMIDDLPQLLGATEDTMMASLKTMVSKRDYNMVENKLFSYVLNSSDINQLHSKVKILNNLNPQTSAGKATKLLLKEFDNSFGNIMKYKMASNSEAVSTRPDVLGALYGVFGVRSIVEGFQFSIDKTARQKTRIEWILKDPIKLKKMTNYIRNMGEGQKEVLSKEIAGRISHLITLGTIQGVTSDNISE